MACLEHNCNTCGHEWASNDKLPCPKCGGADIYTMTDETEETVDYPDDYQDSEE